MNYLAAELWGTNPGEIREQKEHHKKKSYNDELIEFLKLYNVDYDLRYLWNDEN